MYGKWLVILGSLLLLLNIGASTSECVGGEDNPACAAPYWMDDNSEAYWDSTAAEELGTPDGINPTVFFPGHVYEQTEGSPVNSDADGVEYYIENSGEDDGNFGRGEIQENSYTYGFETKIGSRDGAQYIIDEPFDGMCGDGQSAGGVTGFIMSLAGMTETSASCPTDEGLVDGSSGTETSVTEEIGTIDGENVVPIFEENMEILEYGTQDNGGDVQYDVTSGDTDETLSIDTIDSPDFYISSSDNSQLRKVRPNSYITEEILSITDYSLDSEQEYSHYDEWVHTEDFGGIFSECDDTHENISCSSEGDYPDEIEENTVTDYNLDSTTSTETVSSEWFMTETRGDGVGYSVESNSDSFDITVHYNHYDTAEIPANNVESETTIYQCSDDGDQDCEDHTSDTQLYEETDDGTYNPGVSSTSYSWEIERFNGMNTEQVFHTDDSQTSRDAVSKMFSNSEDYSDPIHHNSFGGDGWYSVNIENIGLPVENHHAIGISTFDLTTQDGDFTTERTSHRTYNVDGPDGHGDGLIAYNEESGIVGNTPGFMESEQFDTGGLDQDINIDCPGDYTKCVAIIDLGLQDFNNWDNLDPNEAVTVETVSKAHTSESLSTCKTFQRLGGDITCTYEHTDTPLHDGPYSDEDNVWRHFMEGELVNTAEYPEQDYPLVYEGRITTPDSCVFNGTEHREGSMENIGDAIMLEYGEESRSLESTPTFSQQICLNKDGGIGGEWYHINDPEANQYLRDNDGSLDSSDYQDYFREHPNANDASPEADIPESGVALEGNCVGEVCTSYEADYIQAPFVEGIPPAEANPDLDESGTHILGEDLWESNNPVKGLAENTYEFTTTVIHNRVHVSDETDVGASNLQDQQVNPGTDLGVMENSQVNIENDQWALTPNLEWAVGHDGTPYPPGECHRVEDGDQIGEDGKADRAFANSFVYVDEDGDGNWVDPDDTQISVEQGGLSCNLQGEGSIDWGYGYDTGVIVAEGLLREAGGLEGGAIERIQISNGADGEVETTEETDTQADLVYSDDDDDDDFGGLSAETSDDDGSSNEICIGTGCDDYTGEPNTLDDDEFVNQSGDIMTGTLYTDAVESSAIDICIGSDRGCNEIDVTSGPALGEDNTEADPDFTLQVPDIKPLNGEICLGEC